MKFTNLLYFLTVVAVGLRTVNGEITIGCENDDDTCIKIGGKTVDIYPKKLDSNPCAHMLWKAHSIENDAGLTSAWSGDCVEVPETTSNSEGTRIKCPFTVDGSAGSFDTIVVKFNSDTKLSASLFGTELALSSGSLKVSWEVTWPFPSSSPLHVKTEVTFKELPKTFDMGGLTSWLLDTCGATLSGIQKGIADPDSLVKVVKYEDAALVMKSFELNLISKIKVDFPKGVTADGQVSLLQYSGYEQKECSGEKKGDVPTAICFKFSVLRSPQKLVIDPPVVAEVGLLSSGVSLKTIIILVVLAVVLLIVLACICCYCCKCCKCCCCYGKCDYIFACCRKTVK